MRNRNQSTNANHQHQDVTERTKTIEKQISKDRLDSHSFFNVLSLFTSKPLYKYSEIPEYLKINDFIHGGYRKDLTLQECFHSLFWLHNETGNVLTHFLAFVCFGYLLVQTLVTVLWDAELIHQLVFCVFLGGAAVCFLFSAVYHLLLCHSETTCMKVAQLDYTGIAILVLVSFYPPLYFGFWCSPISRVVYLTWISIVGVIALVCPLFEWYHKNEAHWFRVGLFTMIAVSGVVPAVHSRLMRTWLPNDAFLATHELLQVEEIHMRIAMMYVFYGIGLFFYLSKVPERWFPGYFDYYFNSHQLWHILTFVGTLIHLSNCFSIYDIWKATGGDCAHFHSP